MSDVRAWGLVIVIAFGVIFTPDIVNPNDWELNTTNLTDGLSIYENEDYVYPPWSLVLLWPYSLMTAEGARMMAVVVIAWMSYLRGWNLGRFLSIVANPLFIYTLLFSNLDLLVITFPILLWEVSQKSKRWSWVGMGIALAIMMIKPQGTWLVILYLLWQDRTNWKTLLRAIAVCAVIILPAALIGSPPLLLQWLDNILHPSLQNQKFWGMNNVSMSGQFGMLVALPAVALVMGGFYLLMRRLNKPWKRDQSYALLLSSSMLISPYTSTQSVIAALAFVPSWSITFVHYILTILTGVLQTFIPITSFWIILYILSALWMSSSRSDLGVSGAKEGES
ncbi:MAG: hypothetical protein CL607_17575 [Anaerolineaceae bacterium]|nr:hypothetical protein [Anaerolineaceae bacterium]